MIHGTHDMQMTEVPGGFHDPPPHLHLAMVSLPKRSWKAGVIARQGCNVNQQNSQQSCLDILCFRFTNFFPWSTLVPHMLHMWIPHSVFGCVTCTEFHFSMSSDMNLGQMLGSQ
ncbi:hypothetical protein MPTK1_3g13350 [Marchantia polymorpha subsp. ruderalis]|uniref:Uncharacterized protein n=2 Tax=Marchantia polymorpha TaxID=3197 RepID=A0AAF6B0D7_MARPO|nr:hypothetical protein MARPO_0050s0127 [Marchantia polymorpha]BBN05471.1 hypothetical protein Mp_3g13350 [Marchantia polymorpha subsp. ruderalis]|eukprot:PTQ38684.1 hypothetical protein MARPO_0050s0127 [Marchantia polymorpha]